MKDDRQSRNPDEIPAKSAGSVTRIGTSLFDHGTGMLHRDGEEIPLRAKSGKVLALLSSRPGEVVGKAALLDSAWPDLNVTEDSLVQCIADIRRALGPDAGRLVTFRKRGYRLDAGGDPASDTRVEPLGPKSRPRMTWVAGLGVVGLALVLLAGLLLRDRGPVPFGGRIAVLVRPFENLGQDADADYLGHALSEGVIARLARFEELAVISAATSRKLEGGRSAEMGRDVKADYVLEGSQHRVGDTLRVTARLVAVDDGAHVWTATYDREVGGLFAVQSELVQNLAGTIGYRIGYVEAPPGGRDRIAALHYHLRGRNALQSGFDAAANAEFRTWNERAIAADPEASWGWSGLAWHYRLAAQFGWNGLDRGTALRLAAENADKGLALGPEDYYANFVRAGIHETAGEMDRAAQFYDRAIALNPSASNALVLSTSPLLYAGQAELAIERIETAMEIDPLHPPWFHWQLAWALWRKGDCTAALDRIRMMPRITPPAHGTLAVVLACLDRKEEARAALAVYMDQRPGFTLSSERARFEGIWTEPGGLDAWIDTFRDLGAPA
ncbi:MAG: winged helix-turn-helix domain-containing tetratricopeptide repeat protein [Pseudooceanicola sp.]